MYVMYMYIDRLGFFFVFWVFFFSRMQCTTLLYIGRLEVGSRIKRMKECWVMAQAIKRKYIIYKSRAKFIYRSVNKKRLTSLRGHDESLN